MIVVDPAAYLGQRSKQQDQQNKQLGMGYPQNNESDIEHARDCQECYELCYGILSGHQDVLLKIVRGGLPERRLNGANEKRFQRQSLCGFERSKRGD